MADDENKDKGGNGGAGSGAEGGAGKDDQSLAGGAKSKESQGDAAKAAAAKAEADKTAAAEKAELDKQLEGKTEAEKTEILKKREDEKKAKAEYEGAAPEKYEFKLPDGFTEDKEAMVAFQALAKKLNLSQGKSQELVDLFVKMDKARGDAAQAEFEKVTEGWKEETKQSYGANFSEAQSNAGRAIEWAEGKGIKGLRELFDSTRVGNARPLFQMLDLVGKAVAEDKLHVPGGQGGKGGKTPGQVMYPEGAMAEASAK